MSNIPLTPLDGNNSVPQSPFEQIKRFDSDGNEYWSARDLVAILRYASWQRMQIVCSDIYSSFCLEDDAQREIVQAIKVVGIGSGALREIEDWHLSDFALERLLHRVASYKPEAVRALQSRNAPNMSSNFRIETQVAAILFDYCEQVGLNIVHQYYLEGYYFDFCVANTLLIEVDELHHSLETNAKHNDLRKNQIAIKSEFKLLRIKVPFSNVAKLCGIINRLLNHTKPCIEIYPAFEDDFKSIYPMFAI